MSIATVVTRGFGGGAIGFIVTRGYGNYGAASSPYVGPMGRYRSGIAQRFPWAYTDDRGTNAARDEAELQEMAKLYLDWRDGDGT